MFRTRWGETYLPPSAYHIERAAHEAGLDTRATDAIRDMTILLAGEGQPLTAEELREQARNEARNRPLRRTVEGTYMIPETGEVFKRAKEARERQEMVIFNYNLGMRDFMIAATQNPVVKGRTPMETAVYTFKAMRDGLPELTLSAESESPEMQLFGALGLKPKMPSKLDQEMRRKWSALKSLDKWERAMLVGSDVHLQREEGKGGTRESDPAIDIEIAKLLDTNLQKAFKISRTLSSLSGLNNPSFVRWKNDPSGPEVSYKPMESLGSFAGIRQSAYAYKVLHPTIFKHKLVNREFRVRKRGINRDKQQLLYVLVDGSGSMDGPRIAMATGALLNRLRGVMKGDAKLWYRMFDDEVGPEHSVLDQNEALSAVKHVLDGSTYSGGMTNIDNALKYGVEAVRDKMASNPKLIKPEILLVTDGEDPVETSFEDLQGIRLHAIMCCTGKQRTLQKLCNATKGLYIHLD